jgi:aerobic carbon-monoxide dehydrogenase large subunit
VGAGVALSPGRFLGRPVPRREDERILRGAARYLDDIELPGMLHAAFVRSPLAHAAIADVRRPSSAEGLVAVLTADDLAGRVRAMPIQGVPGVELADEPHPILAAGEVRYAGQAVALVVATSRALAEDAAELVEVDYDERAAVVDPRASDFVLERFERSGRDVDGAFAAAERVVRGRYALPRLVAAPLEARGILARHDAGADLLTVWCSTQDTHRALAQLAHVLDRPDDAIRVIVPDVGGAFGSKGGIAPEAAAVAVAAMDLGRPVKWAEDRFENFLAGYQGRGMEADVELALSAEGDLLGVRARILADLGGYLLPSTAIPGHTAAMLMAGCYDVGAVAVELVGARTNKVPTGPYRGAGRPEAAYFLERALDDAARELGLDPVAVRRRNLVRRFPHRTPLGLTYDSGDYERCLDVALELVDPEQHSDDDSVVATGVALYVERAGGQWESADVTVAPSGRVVIHSSTSPHGQGHDTAFAQIAAERLGLALEDIVVRFGDSAVVPRGVGTFGSRSMAMGGSALVVALDRIVARVREVAAHLLGAPSDEVIWEDGRVSAPGGEQVSFVDVAAAAYEPARLSAPGGKRVSFAEVAAAAYQPARLAPGMEPGLQASGRFSSELVFSSGAYAAVVEIERATGRLTVRRLAAVDDCGTVINPLLAHGQVIGGVAQALGECLVEEAIHDERGQPRTASFADYSLLTTAEMPPVSMGVVESPSPLNPLGAKGVGEGGAIGALPAVANAVAAALGGAPIDPPYSQDKLWRALRR